MPGFILLTLVIIALALAVYFLVKTSVASSAEKKLAHREEAEKYAFLEHAMTETGARRAIYLMHIRGLPLDRRAACAACLLEDSFVFLRDGVRITLPFDKIMDASVKTYREMKNSGPLEYTAGAESGVYLVFLYKGGHDAPETIVLLGKDPEEARGLIGAFNESPGRVRNIKL